MRTAQARRILNENARHHEEWTCGPARIHFSGKDENPRFDRRLDVFLDLSPQQIDLKKVESLLSLLDRLK